MAALELCVARLADSLEPPPRQTVSEGADQNRRLSSEASAERGEWRTDRARYQRAIMDALSPYSPYERVVVMSSSQIGKTEILNNFVGYIIDRDPATFGNRNIVMVPSPTVKGASRIEAAWLQSNRQSYWVPCPDCGHFQILRWPNLEWPDADPAVAAYRGEHCSVLIPACKKPWMWRAASGGLQIRRRKSRTSGSASCTRRDDEAHTSVDLGRARAARSRFGRRNPPRRTSAASARGLLAPIRPKRQSWAAAGIRGLERPAIRMSPPTASNSISSNSWASYSKGQPVREWRPKKGVRHEAFDARVYAALRALVSMGMVLDAEADRVAASPR